MPHRTKLDIADLVQKLVPIARGASAIILDVRRTDFEVRSKADKSPVTLADERAEAFILEQLATLTPEIPIVAEEAYAAGTRPDVSGGVLWLVDALDGTKEFTRNGSDFTVNIALVDDGRPMCGIVAAPALGTLYGGAAGGAFQITGDGPVHPISVRTPPEDGLVAVISKSHQSNEEDFLRRFGVKEIVNRGSSLKFCLVASGEADIYPRLGPTSEWDIAAGHAVLAAAGGSVTTVDGAPMRYGKADIRNPHFVARGKVP